MQTVILASSSKQRQALMRALNLPLQVVAPEIEEKNIRDPDPKKQAEKIARAKAEWVAERHEGIIIAADNFSVCQNRILEKPRDAQEAKAMLRLLSGKTGLNYSGFCYLDKQNHLDFSTTAEARFTFRKLEESEIQKYAEQFPVTTWSGAFSPAYPYGLTLIAAID